MSTQKSIKSETGSMQNSAKEGEDSNRQSSTAKKSSNGQNSLMAAVNAKDYKAAEVAIKQGAVVNFLDDHGWTPLRKAARDGNMNMVSLLLENGADVTIRDQVVVLTSASWGRVDVLRQLLENKANVGPDTEWEVTPLVAAAQHGHIRTIQTLIEFKADVNQQDASGLDPLMMAWEHNWAEVVLYLVEQGANMKNSADWVSLASSPIIAAQLAEGTFHRNVLRAQAAEADDTVTASTYRPDVKMPMEALCRWIEMVPKAAVAFLDKVLMRTPKDAPARCSMRGRMINTDYLSVHEWLPKEQPNLLKLAPKDSGSANIVNTFVLHQKNILNGEILFALSRSDCYIFESFALRCLMHHCWTVHTQPRYIMDILLILPTLLLLLVWTFTADGNNNGYGFLLLAAVASLAVNLGTDIFEELRQFRLFQSRSLVAAYFQDPNSCTGASIFRYLRIGAALLLIALLCVTEAWKDEYRSNTPDVTRYLFDATLCLVTLLQWAQALSFLRASECIGPFLVSIFRSINHIGPFLLIFSQCLVCFWHAAEVTKGKPADEVMMLQWRLLLLRDFDFDQYTEGNFYSLQVMIFLIASFTISVVLLNISVAVVIVGFEFEHEMCSDTFMMQRAHLCLKYFLSMEGRSSAPADYTLRKIFPSRFAPPVENAYLWACHVVSGQLSTGLKVTSGRIGWIKNAVNESMSVFKKLEEEIGDVEHNLKRRWTQVHRDLQASKTSLLEAVQNVSDAKPCDDEQIGIAEEDISFVESQSQYSDSM